MKKKSFKNHSGSKQSGSMYKTKDLQLPYVNRTINATSNHMSDSRQTVRYFDKFSWVLVPKEYERLSFQEISEEYKGLRHQLFSINELVEKQLNKLELRYHMKQRTQTVEPQKVKEIKEKQIENNQSILRRMKKQYSGLNQRKAILPPKQDLQQQIQSTVEQIKKTKAKIKDMNLKSKKVGEKIIGTDDVIEQMKDLERQEAMWIKRNRTLSEKLKTNAAKREQVATKMKRIFESGVKVEEYIKEEIHHRQEEEQNNKLQEIYKQMLHSRNVRKKNLESMNSLKQQKYHQLLRLLDQHHNRDAGIQKNISGAIQKKEEVTEEIVHLEHRLNEVRQQSDHSFSSNLYTPEKTINSKRNTGFSKPSTTAKLSHYNYTNSSHRKKGSMSKGSLKKDASVSAYSQAHNIESSPIESVILEKIQMRNSRTFKSNHSEEQGKMNQNIAALRSSKVYNKKAPSKSVAATLSSQNNSMPVTAKKYEKQQTEPQPKEMTESFKSSQNKDDSTRKEESAKEIIVQTGQKQQMNIDLSKLKQATDQNVKSDFDKFEIDRPIAIGNQQRPQNQVGEDFDKQVQINKKLIETHRKSYSNLSNKKFPIEGECDDSNENSGLHQEKRQEEKNLLLNIDLGKIQNDIKEIEKKSFEKTTKRSTPKIKNEPFPIDEQQQPISEEEGCNFDDIE